MRSRRISLALACAVLVWSAGARADDPNNLADLSIEQLMELRVASVYGASKHEQKVTQAPSSVSIVTADEIRRFGHRTLADVLRSVRGLYVSDDRNYPYFGIRGFQRPGDYNSRVLVTIDGHRMNDNVYDGAYFGHEGMVDVELIERVEVIRGPSSSLYGSSAFFGVINVVTKDGAQLAGTELAAGAGSLDTYKGRFTHGQTFANGVEWLVSGSHHTSHGASRLYYPEFDQRISSDARAANDGVIEDMDDEAAASFFTKIQSGGLSLAAFVHARDKQVPTASFNTIFNDPRLETRDERRYLQLGYERSLSDAMSLQVRGSYDQYRYHGDYPYDYAEPGDPPNAVMYRDNTAGNWAGLEWQLTAHAWGNHTLIFGGEYRDSLREYQDAYEDYYPDPREYALKDERSSSTLGLFAQDEIKVRDDLVLTGGVRFDHYSGSFGSTVNPRVGLIYNPSPTGTIKVLYGQAFRAPNAFERYYNPEQRNRPDLDPERIRTYELGYEQYVGRRHRFSVSTYYYDVSKLISQGITDSADQYFANLDSVRAAGVELEAESKFDSGALIRASYALQRAEDANGGAELSSSPRHLGKLNVSLPLMQGRMLTSLELQYHGKSRTVYGGTADDFLLTNFTIISEQLLRGLELSAGIHNLFDTRYGYPGAADHLQPVIEQNGRTIEGKVTYRFGK
jgi:outer membrane receptor for ferrienterochelin and colicins